MPDGSFILTLDVAKVLHDRPGVLNLHLATEMTGRDTEVPTMTMLYKIGAGAVGERHYGLNLARAIGFPQQFMEIAERVTVTLEEQAERRKAESQSRKLLNRRKLVLELHETLKRLRDSGMDDNALGSYMRRLQAEFIARMDEIDGGERPSRVEEVG